jgi:FixJ family two-component response regulator
MSESVPQIYVVDDDMSVREAVGNLIRSAGLSVRTFALAQEMLASLRKELPNCLVLDIQLPDINGFELQRELATCRANCCAFCKRNLTSAWARRKPGTRMCGSWRLLTGI